MNRVGIIGAGSVGRALGASLARARADIAYGVRDPATTGNLPGPVRPLTEIAADRDVLILAVPAGAAVTALAALPHRSGKVIVDCTNPIRWDGGPVWTPPPEGSVAAQLARAFPDVVIVKGFNHFGAEIHSDPALPGGPADALFASDDPTARSRAMELARRVGFRPLDAGPLRNAALLENLAVAWIHMSSVGGLGRHFAFRLEARG